MKLNAALFFIYAVVLFVGGIFAYLKAGSTASLITSTSFSIPLIISCLIMLKRSMIAEYCAFFIVLAVDALFWWRYYSTGKFMPAGMLLLLSTLVLVIAYFNLKKRLTLNT